MKKFNKITFYYLFLAVVNMYTLARAQSVSYDLTTTGIVIGVMAAFCMCFAAFVAGYLGFVKEIKI